MNIQGLIFDLDGTLIDNFSAIYESYRYALGRLGAPMPTFPQVKKTVGGSVEVTMRKFVPPEQVERGVALFREHYNQAWHDGLRLLDGVAATLPQLTAMGLRLAVATNKRGPFARKVVGHLGIAQHFVAVLGVLDVPRPKPHPDMIEQLLQTMAVQAEAAVFIGDSPFDVEAARVANLPVWCLPTGTHDERELAAARPDRVFHRFEELPQLVLQTRG